MTDLQTLKETINSLHEDNIEASLITEMSFDDTIELTKDGSGYKFQVCCDTQDDSILYGGFYSDDNESIQSDYCYEITEEADYESQAQEIMGDYQHMLGEMQ